MATIKSKVMEFIRALPENVSISDIMAELYFRLQVDAGLEELDKGKGISHDEVKKRAANWRSK